MGLYMALLEEGVLDVEFGDFANAVYHASGVRVRDLPIRPDRVLDALAR